VLRYLNSGSNGDIGFALSLLQSFGNVKVLSSPKISVMNNQTAVLKVVDNRIYFTIGVQVTPGTDTTAPLVTYTSTPNTVPVGFVMSVTPQIKKTGAVTMNVRPTISRIIGFVNDPNPALAQNGVTSRIPEIQTREIESILKVASGDIAVMGGLMQESVSDNTDAVPGPASLPFVGGLFKYRNDSATKSELVIFLRPVVIRDASLEGDYSGFKKLQPDKDFFRKQDKLPLPRAWQKQAEVTEDDARADIPKIVEQSGRGQ
jgi:general secretion pathway protein D